MPGGLPAALCLGGLLALACSERPCVPEHAAPAAGNAPFRVLTWNVNFALAGDEEAIRVLEEVAADMVFLQEVNPPWRRFLEERLAHVYPHRHYLPHHSHSGGMAVLSQMPVEPLEAVSAPEAWFPAWPVLVETGCGPLQVMSLHLRPPVSDSGSLLMGFFTTRAARLREARYVLESLDPDLPIMVLGDFNESARGQSTLHVSDQGFTNLVARFTPDAPTWRGVIGFLPMSWQLDHVFTRPPLVPRGAEVLGVGNSDHLPVLASISWDPQRCPPHEPNGD